MKIVIINGTQVKGCTYNMKETFISGLRDGNEIVEFYLPKDMPYFCCGCKKCFLEDEKLCPHSDYTMPIWHAILEANLLVFAFPVYALRSPGQVKALLDHFCCHWMVHRPDKAMFSKRAVIITNSIGAPNRSAQKDVVTSLNWMGVSSVKCVGAGLMEGAIWEQLSDKKRNQLNQKMKSLASKYKKYTQRFLPAKKNIKITVFFEISRMIHKGTLKQEDTPSADNLHWIKNGWIKN